MKNTLLFLLLLAIFACEDDNTSSADFATSAEFSVTNSNGVDLLDTNNDNSFKESDISIYYVIDGKAVKYNKPSYDRSKGFFIKNDDGENKMVVFLNDDETVEYPLTLVKWNELDTDTIKSIIERKQGVIQCTKVWYNDVLMWNGDSICYFKIIK